MCDCLDKLAPAMQEKGLWIDSTLQSRQAAISVSWYPGYQRRRGERLPVMLAEFCPFCGQRYDIPEYGDALAGG